MAGGPDFQQSQLWLQAFEEPRIDALPQEQNFFRTQYLALREKAAQLTSRIASDMPGLTVHDITHLDALWDSASLAADGDVSLNPPEAFVLGASILLHDAAMSLAAYPRGIEDIRDTLTWKDSVARMLLSFPEEETKLIDPNAVPEELESRLIPDVLRRLHAEQAEVLAVQGWPTADGQIYLIDNLELRTFYGQTIGKIAHSHWWSIHKVEEELAVDLGGFAQQTKNRVDKIKLACLLRVADALHLDSRRAPRFIRAITQPGGDSAAHWDFQERLARPHLDSDAVVFTAAQAFERKNADAWWLAFDTLNAVDRELNDVAQLLQSRGRETLKARRVKGAGSPEMMSRTVTTRGWRPVDARLQISDVPRIVENLGGAKLYGDDPTVALRELLQNAADAVQARRRFEEREEADWGKITVSIAEREGDEWLIVEDTGIGMSEMVLTGPLLDFGASFWRSPMAMEEFPGLMSSGMRAIGRFGIGFFSVFMLGSEVRVYSRRADRGVEHGRLLEFRGGTSMRPILSVPIAKELPKDGGTRIEVKLKHKSGAKHGLLHSSHWSLKRYSLARVVAAVAPNLDVALYVQEDAKVGGVSTPGDWLTIAEPNLIGRLNPATDPKENVGDSDGRLRPLVNEDGKVVGRASINPDRYYWQADGGWVTVDGLRANRMFNLQGLLLGEAVTASRDAATPLVDQKTLARWASEQANLIAAAAGDDEEQAKVAEVVLECGGEVGDLKILKLGSQWLSSEEFNERLSDLSVVLLSFDGEFRYDEDNDDVIARDFKDNFEPMDDVGIVLKHQGSVLRTPGFLWPNALTDRPIWPDSQVAALIRQLIVDAWGATGDPMNAPKVSRVIGSVGGTEITRTVSRFSRHPDEEVDKGADGVDEPFF
jgi:hypothetical protein